MFALCNYSQTRFISTRSSGDVDIGYLSDQKPLKSARSSTTTEQWHPSITKMSELDLFRNNEISLNICERQLWVFAISILYTHISYVISLSIPIRIDISFFLNVWVFSRLCVHFYLIPSKYYKYYKLHVSVCVL